MTSFDLLPAINYVSIENDDKRDYEKADIELIPEKDNILKFSFGLSGLTKLNDASTGKVNPFYLFVAITFLNEKKEYEIISLSDMYADEESILLENLRFLGNLTIPQSKVYESDFVNNMYYFTIVHSYQEISTQEDMIRILNPNNSTLFRTKLNTIIKG